MAVLATYKGKGEYGIPGAGIFTPGQTREIPASVAHSVHHKTDLFDVVYTDPANDLPYRDEAGKVNRVGYFGPVDSRFGYGGAGILILRALTALGIDALVHPHYNGTMGDKAYMKDLPREAADQLARRNWVPRVQLMHCLPTSWSQVRADVRVGWTMFETSRIPAPGSQLGDWKTAVNTNADRLIVPCTHNKEVFAECGVTVPISVLPYGLDTDIWPYFERPERDIFTVVQFGDLTSRKGPEEAMLAFQRAFPGQRDVRLVLKAHSGVLTQYHQMRPEFRNDPRIQIVDRTYWTRTQIIQFLHDADCFIWLSRGEGFGLPPLQAALTGLPVVMTTHTGMGEYYRPQFFYGVRNDGTSPCALGGDWYEPDVEHAAEQLRKVYDDRKASLKRGKSAATYVRNNFSLDAFAKRVGDYLEGIK